MAVTESGVCAHGRLAAREAGVLLSSGSGRVVFDRHGGGQDSHGNETEAQKEMTPKSVVAIANKEVPIELVCRRIGVHMPDALADGRSMKLVCPFAKLWHDDGGAMKSFRIYPESNTAHCFAGCGMFSPVWLAAQYWGVSTREAATRLLDIIGYKPLTVAEMWKNAQLQERKPDVSSLSLALRVFCDRSTTGWDEKQFDRGVANTLSRCLGLLREVHTEAEAREWLGTTKLVMLRVLGE